MTQQNEPILDYAKPTTPNRGIEYAFDQVDLPDGFQLIQRDSVSSGWRDGWILLVVGLVLTASGIGSIVVDPKHFEGAIALILCVLGLLIGFAGLIQFRSASKPVVIVVRSDAIISVVPQRILGRRREWKTKRIREIQITKQGISILGKPIASVFVVTWISHHALIRNIDAAEADEIGERISAITPLKVTRRGLFSLT